MDFLSRKTGYQINPKLVKIQDQSGKGKEFHRKRQKRPFIDGPRRTGIFSGKIDFRGSSNIISEDK
jgi:hypothetical protein